MQFEKKSVKQSPMGTQQWLLKTDACLIQITFHFLSEILALLRQVIA